MQYVLELSRKNFLIIQSLQEFSKLQLNRTTKKGNFDHLPGAESFEKINLEIMVIWWVLMHR